MLFYSICSTDFYYSLPTYLGSRGPDRAKGPHLFVGWAWNVARLRWLHKQPHDMMCRPPVDPSVRPPENMVHSCLVASTLPVPSVTVSYHTLQAGLIFRADALCTAVALIFGHLSLPSAVITQ